MAGILDHQGIFYQQGVLSTQQFRDSILGRNLPPPVNETLTQSGLVSKLDDIGRVINVPIFGTGDENIPIHYDEDKKMFPLGTFFRTTQNVNLNPYSPQNDEYVTYNLTIPPTLPKPIPEEFGERERKPYPTSYSSDRFGLIPNGDSVGVEFPFNVIDNYKGLNFQSETSLGLVGGVELENSIINKIAQVEDEANPNTDSTGYITEPLGNIVDNYVNKLRGNPVISDSLPNDAIGWNEYNSSNKIPGGDPDAQEGVEPTMGVEIRMGSLLERTSLSQVQFTFELLKRNSYRPLYNDRRLQGTSEEGTNGRYYIGSEKSTNRGALITKTFDSSDFNGDVDTSGNGQRTDIEGVGEPFGEPNKFFWTTGGEQNFNEKTLLYKTQQLVDNNQDGVYINQTKKFFKDKKQNRLISRGNAISESLLIDAEANGNYCRVWTVNDRYNYRNAIRNTGLFTSPKGNKGFSTTSIKKSLSVLTDAGQPKYYPTLEDSTSTKKKFMLSIENLAWSDNLADLPVSEIGPGDKLTGNKGRIMWFPPYDLTFDENTSANWNKTDFIGRNEPVYTYNNVTRTGSLSFKIVVDHPRVINGYRGKSNNLIERFLAGCVAPDDFLNALDNTVSQGDKDEILKKLNEKKTQKVDNSSETFKEEANLEYNCPTDNSECNASDKVYDENQLNTIVSKIQGQLDKLVGTDNPSIKVTVDGYSGKEEKRKEGLNLNQKTKEAQKDADDRATEVRNELRNQLGTKNIKYVKNGVVRDGTEAYVEITYQNDSESAKSAQAKKEEQKNAAGTYDPEDIKLIDSILIDESAYFDFIDENYPNYFKTISEKIKYFNPTFHSITPEGLNSRLTFLNQCLRQGPSIYDKGDDIRPQNLSFGRPPICILRIGDFYYTKIAIQSLSVSYDAGGGIKYDLNPEGIGVQPMIATVQMSIDLIGGQSLNGPINRLQNAVSFNYYANTEIYDPRSDTIKNGKIVDGLKLGEVRKEGLGGQEALNQFIEDLKQEGVIDQLEDSETGDDADGDGDNVLEIVAGTDLSVTIKSKDGTPPADIVIGNDPNPNNKIEYKIKIGSKEREGTTDTDSSGSISLKEINGDIVDPTILSTNDADLNARQQELETAKDNFKTFKTQQYKDDYNNAREALKKQEKKNKDYTKGKEDKVKVVAFLSENKSKTKITKTFTITKDGLT